MAFELYNFVVFYSSIPNMEDRALYLSRNIIKVSYEHSYLFELKIFNNA